MAEALFPAEAYREALLKLLPRGRVWPKDPGSLQFAVMAALAPTFERLDARAQTLLLDEFPTRCVELLPEWEATLGLPDPCEGEDQTLQQRRAQVIIKLFDGGGQTKGYYLTVLARLGYEGATITEFAPFRAEVSAVETPLYSEDWWYVWQVNLPELRTFYFQADVSAVGEPLEAYSESAVFCVFDAIKPAHTYVVFTADPA